MNNQKSEPDKVTYDRNSLRNTIKLALREKWTQDLEDRLFWPLAAYNQDGCARVAKETKQRIIDAIKL